MSSLKDGGAIQDNVTVESVFDMILGAFGASGSRGLRCHVFSVQSWEADMTIDTSALTDTL